MQSRAPAVCFAYVLCIVNILMLLGPSIVGRDRLAFRDTDHFYTPLYDCVAARQSQQWFPMWNPLDLMGMPPVGESTTAVYYPVRMAVYSLGLSASQSIAVYVALHLLIAAVAIHVASTVARAGAIGTALAIVVYPFAGPIFFLIYNPPFLVGAAWLPLMLAGCFRLWHQASMIAIATTSWSIAMMLTGGDPHSIVNGGLVVTAALILRLWKHRGCRAAMLADTSSSLRILIASVLGVAVAMPQVAASVDWSLQSDRTTASHQAERLEFSIEPQHWSELIVPYAWGRLFPFFTRTSSVLDPSERTWVVTLFVGTLPLWLMFLRAKRSPWRWDFWDCLPWVGLFLSMAGFYQVLTYLTPGYGAFRYPGKWSVLLAMGIAIGAARVADRWLTNMTRASRHMMYLASICIAVTAFSFLVLWFAVKPLAEPESGAATRSDVFWGPLDVQRALSQFMISAFVALLPCVVVACYRVVGTSKLIMSQPALPGLLILALTSIQLGWVSSVQMAAIHVADEAKMMTRSVGDDVSSTESPKDSAVGRALRMKRERLWPVQWQNRSDAGRLLQVSGCQRQTEMHRWHLANHHAVLNSPVSIVPRRINWLWHSINAAAASSGTILRGNEWQRLASWLGVTERWEIGDGAQGGQADGCVRRKVAFDGIASARWDLRWQLVTDEAPDEASRIRDRVASIITGQPDDLPWVEVLRQSGRRSSDASTQKSNQTGPQILWIEQTPERITLQVKTAVRGLLTVKSYQDGHWWVDGQRISQNSSTQHAKAPLEPALRVDSLMMGTVVEAGLWKIEFFYRPWWQIPALWVSALATSILTCLLVTGAVAGYCRHRRWIFKSACETSYR